MTSQHDALYRTICDYPDDDTPRLIFADLIEEQGDSDRAAFIRAQVQLATVPQYDPIWVKYRHFHPGTLSGSTAAHTLPKPLPDGFSWRHYRFRRGFPWLVMALGSGGFVERAADLFAMAPVRALSFDDRARPDVSELAHCPHLARIQRLDFADSHCDADDMAALAHSPHTESMNGLVFEGDGVTPEGLEILAGSALFSRIEYLRLERNAIPPALLVDALAAADEPGKLRELSLPFCDLHAPDASTMFGLPALRGLETLDLRDNPHFGPGGTAALAESSLLRGLRVLTLESTYPGVTGVGSLTATGALAGVRSLDLSANRLGPVAARLLAESPRTRGLRVLNLSNNPIGRTGAASLAGSRHLADLIELDLQDCDIGDAGALALAESPYLNQLLRLDVRSWSVGRPLGEEARAALVQRFGPCVAV